MSDFQSAALTWVCCATLFLAAGLAVAWFFRARAPVSHIILLLSLLMVLAMPLLSWGVRRAGVGMLPPASSLSAETPGTGTPHSTPLERVFDPGIKDVQAIAPVTTGSTPMPLAHSRNSDAPSVHPDKARTPDQANSIRLIPWLLWGGLSLVFVVRLARGSATALRLRRDSTLCDDPALRAALHTARLAVGIDRSVELRQSDGVSCPMICCWGTPCVLVPARAPSGVDWRAVMVHELAHLVRKDYISAMVAEVVCCLLPWHPLAWLSRRQLASAAEQACDDWAVRHASSEADYAGSLVAFATPKGGHRGIAMAPAIISRSGVASRVARVLASQGRGAFRVGRTVAAGVTLTAIVAVGATALSQPGPIPPSQPQPVADAPHSGQPPQRAPDVPESIAAFIDYWRETADASDDNKRMQLSSLARDLAELNDPRTIPAMIGVIDADNTYHTVYGVGYFGLARITGVEYSSFHDGAWWRRWWEANKAKFPNAQDIPIPELPRSAEGTAYIPFPVELDTFDGKLRWLLKEYDRLHEGKLKSLGLTDISRALGKHKDPRSIPTMIGVIDADNSYDTIYPVGCFGLGGVTGVEYSRFHDGPWWRRWWEANKAKFPEARDIPIPDLPKTAAGKAYTPFPEDLHTFDGKVRCLLTDYERLREGTLSALELGEIIEALAEHKDPRAIPTMIGVIDGDNSYATISRVQDSGMSALTGVPSSGFHDGAWWRRWWQANKAKFPDAQDIPIPDLPKTRHGANYIPFPADLDTFEGLARQLGETFVKPPTDEHAISTFREFAMSFVRLQDQRAIPVLIGAIDADNSYYTVYFLGYFGLGKFTDVAYSPYHDGAWWRRWWQANKGKFPPEVQATAIPDYPKTARGLAYTPIPESFETLEGKMAWLREMLAAGQKVDFHKFSEAVASHNDPRAIPFLIELIDTVHDQNARDGVCSGLGKLAKVKRASSKDAAWWRRWWEEHKNELLAVKDPAAVVRENTAEQARLDAQFEGFPCQDLLAGGDERKRYFLIGPAQSQKMPEKGWRLLLILPGGGGGADFQSFCRTIHCKALPEGFVAAQLVAPAWTSNPNRTVWPTRILKESTALFTTEDFIRAVVEDAANRLTIDRSQILALGWSSSGPALYCDSLQADTPVTGWLIAMSVFRPQWMPDLAAAKGRRYYLLHSPGDKMIPIDQHARSAERRLRESGAAVTLAEYTGGHGWTDDPLGHIRRGVDWLITEKP